MARSKDPEFFAGITCVNVRTLAGVDFKKLHLKELDGASFKVESDPGKEMEMEKEKEKEKQTSA